MKKEVLFKKLREGIDSQDYLLLQQFVEIAQNEYPEANETLEAQVAFANLNWDYAKAVEYLLLLCVQNPGETHRQVELALGYFKNQQISDAIALLEAIISANPDNMEILAIYAKNVAAHYGGDFELLGKAIAALDRILEANPRAFEPLLDRASAYQQGGQYEEAMQDLQAARLLDPSNTEVIVRMIEINQYQNNPDDARYNFQLLLNLDPENQDFISKFADFLHAQGEYEEAIAQYSIVINKEAEQGFDSAFTRKSRAESYMAAERYQEAVEDLNISYQHAPDNSILLLRAKALAHSGKQKEALADLNQIIKEKDFYENDALLARADLYIEMGDYKKAEAAIKPFISKEELDFYKKDGYYLLGHLHLAKKELKQAAEAWQKAAELYHPDAAEMIETHCKELVEAEKAAKKANLGKEFAQYTEQNSRSGFLTQLFGKLWKVDLEKSMSANEQLNEMPEAFVGFFVEAFRHISISISPQTIILENPNSQTIEAYYKISKETPNSVQLYGQPTDDKPARELILTLQEGYLVISGLMSAADEQQPTMTMYFRQATEEEMKPLDENAQADRMKNLAESFLSGLLQTVVEGLENASSPDGEAASDDQPAQPTDGE